MDIDNTETAIYQFNNDFISFLFIVSSIFAVSFLLDKGETPFIDEPIQ